MPLYHYRCPQCKNEIEELHSVEDRYKQKCPKCKNDMQIVISAVVSHIFEPFYHPNLDSKPVWIKSKKHLKEESDKRGMTSFY